MGDGRSRLKVIVVAYLCEPGRGSERGAGWGVLQALQTFSECTLVTGPESGALVDEWLEQNPHSNLVTEIVGESRGAEFLKRFRVGEFLVYLAWQRRARSVGCRLSNSGEYDVAHHVTLSAFWLPSVATRIGLPSVWGPVGGAVTTPTQLWSLLGWKGVFVEIVDWMAVRLMSLLPSTRRTWRNATVRIAQNSETVDRLPHGLRADTAVMNHAVFHDVPAPENSPSDVDVPRYVVWVSPMESRKGPELAVRALAQTSSTIRMVMVGDGPERQRIEGIAKALDVADRIEFTGLVPHPRAIELISRATVAVYTGMREEGGLALAEAMLLGTPIVVLANGGAGTLARSSVDNLSVSLVEPLKVAQTVAAMATAIELQFERSSALGNSGRTPLIDRQAAIAELERLVASAAQADRGTVA
jgi:glycosyltransferase involved in cell wall biosynthesis